ncbi:TerB family tellurite resistance protein [Bizionia paragorgiae]|jgi:hypothetical protein|uniref:Uncharacterized protein n=1 Tax=Bizionia paragorgiae TaxID=283786 RepID=A0A1H3VGV3_BIZPA|nr:TerB family tellurite resistance protein [Bizionia paragorgiae]MDX1272077.1 TerB family tellurite resistance protein [Bizionia paragorgiae]SDZ74033.1 hypothetical protein SAMN04487990_101154 [Bizionia paragorgiae]
MSIRGEKICLLSDMMVLLKPDKAKPCLNYGFIVDIAQLLKVSNEDFEYALSNSISRTDIGHYNDRIIQFYNLVCLLPRASVFLEPEKLFTLGIKMSLGYESLTKVLYLIDSFPNRRVPKEVLIDAIKIQYN